MHAIALRPLLMRFLVCANLLVASGLAGAAVIEIFDGDSFEAAVENLNPGDTLIVHAGTYDDTGKINLTVKGTASQPVLIKGADGEARPLITRPAGSTPQNTINIQGATYVTIRGLEISGNGDGINMNSNPSYITLEDLDIHDIAVGINFRSNMHHIIVRRTHITRTAGTGEGMYIGCNNSACVVSDSIIENNWIHDTLNATQGDGIEIKKGSHSNIVRDNVIYDTNYPCVLVYGTDGQPRNTIEGNVMWNCGDSGIQAAADAVIRNNIILESPANGFNSQPHQGVTPGNLEFVHNTLIGGSPCVRINTWNGQPGLVFANNAIYCPSGNFAVGGLSGVTVVGNVFEPATSSFPSSGYVTGRSEAQDFINVSNKEVYPTSDSPLIGAADPAQVVGIDFNADGRNGSDAGAYEWTQNQNPGWMIGAGFKDGANNPIVSLNANPTTVPLQGSTTLTWTSSNVDSCNASGDWMGNRPTAGNEMVGPLSTDSMFQLQCMNASGGSASASVDVTIDASSTQPTLTFSANKTSVAYNGSVVLSWSANNVSDCQASGSWSGPKPIAGTETMGSLTVDSAFTQTCTGAGGPISKTVTVSVADPNDDSGSGSGSVGWWMLGLALLTMTYRRRPGTTTSP